MSKLERLGRQIAHEQDLLAERSQTRAQARERLAAFEPQRPSPSRLRYAALAGVPLIAAAAAVVVWMNIAREPALELRVGASDQPLVAGAWVEAPASSAALPLRFSDGTRIDLAPHTRLRVIEVDEHGAHLLLESGRAHVAVVPRANASWRLSVGPFAVRVIGTRFDVHWDPDDDAFGLELAHGEVELSGCVFGGEYRMQLGQAVDASCKRGRLQLRKLTDIAPVEQAHAVTPEPAAAPAPVPAVTAPRALAPKVEQLEPIAKSATAPVAAPAEERHRAPIGEEASQEERELLMIRRRFGGTSRAAVAAFALGRLEFDKRHSHAKAAQWFGTYLKEQPRGSLAREARGRLIEATLAAGERARARVLAAEYLELHASGPHAELAKSLVDAATP